MTIDTMSVAVSLLLSEGIQATVEYPGCIHVLRGTNNLNLFVFGCANPNFGADTYLLPEDFETGASPDDSFDTDIPSSCNDPVLVAQTIAKIVFPDTPHSFGCAHCRNVLLPGDNVVFHQNSDTSIDIFCSNACMYESQE